MKQVIALDVGDKRIGVAAAETTVRFAGPLTTLENSPTVCDDIARLCAAQEAVCVVLGLPRGLDGQDTAQTGVVRKFGHELALHLAVPLYWTDEAVTSLKAEAELRARGKPYVRGDIDALAAAYILEDFMNEQPEHING